MLRSLLIVVLMVGLLACKREEKQFAHYDSVNSLYAQYGCERPVIDPASVSIETLMKTPGTYEGKPVRVDGFYVSTFEHSALYPRAEDAENEIARNGLWVLDGLPPDLDGKHVVVEGIFTSGVKGHLGQWPASLCNVRLR